MRKLIIGFCALVMFIITPSVKADTVVITGGQLSITGIFGQPGYTITGLDFSVTASGGDPGNGPSCLPCVSGTPISISTFLVGTSLGSGTAIINGTTFSNIGFLGEFSFAVQPIVLPNDRLITWSKCRSFLPATSEAAYPTTWSAQLRYSVRRNSSVKE